VVDTGGLERQASGVFVEMAKQARTAIAEADVSCSSPMLARASRYRTGDRRGTAAYGPARVCRGQQSRRNESEIAMIEFHELGLGEPYAISAEHGRECTTWSRRRLPTSPFKRRAANRTTQSESPSWVAPTPANHARQRAGRGGARRDLREAGTTRDAIDVELVVKGRRYVLVDTAGLRRAERYSKASRSFPW